MKARIDNNCNSYTTQAFYALLFSIVLLAAQAKDLLHEVEHMQAAEHTELCDALLSLNLDVDVSCNDNSVVLPQPRHSITTRNSGVIRAASITCFLVRAPPIA